MGLLSYHYVTTTTRSSRVNVKDVPHPVLFISRSVFAGRSSNRFFMSMLGAFLRFSDNFSSKDMLVKYLSKKRYAPSIRFWHRCSKVALLRPLACSSGTNVVFPWKITKSYTRPYEPAKTKFFKPRGFGLSSMYCFRLHRPAKWIICLSMQMNCSHSSFRH